MQISIPTINDKLWDFTRLFQIWQQVNNYNLDVNFDFSQCYFLRPNAVAFLGGLARLIESRNGRAVFAWDTIRYDVLANLKKNGFACIFDGPCGSGVGNAVPYFEFPLPAIEQDRIDLKGIVWKYLEDLWLGRGWVNISDRLNNRIAEKTLEIFVNAFDHSKSQIGVFACGQYFPRKRELELTVADFGRGIPARVRTYLKNPKMSGGDCLKWAFKRGNSTRLGQSGPDVSRGVGLELLKKFIRMNKGKLAIYSHNSYGIIDKNKEVYLEIDTFFEGTLVHITFSCDEKYYKLASESPPGPLF